MAGIFEPVTLPDAAPASGQLMDTGSRPTDYSGSLSALAEVGLRVRGKNAVEDFAEKQSTIQNEFLGDLEENRTARAEIDALKQAHPNEGAAFDAASQRIKTLQQAIKARQINPSEALTRIEAAKREATVKAPMFINEINGLTGARGASFDHESKLIMQRTEIRNKAMAEMGLNPEIPSNVRTYQQVIAAAQTNQYQTNVEAISSRSAAISLGDSVTSAIQVATEKFNNLVAQSGGMENMSAEIREGEITRLTPLTELGGAQAEVEKLLQQTLGAEGAAKVNDTVRNRYAAMISANAITRIKQLDGSIPKTISSNDRQFYEDRVMNNIAVNYPGLYSYIVVQSSLPSNTLGGKTVDTAAGIEYTKYSADLGLGIDINRVTKTGLESESDGTSTPKEIQDNAAGSMQYYREFLKGVQNPDIEVSKAHFQVINNQAKYLAEQPQEFVPSIFDELIASVNDDKFMSEFAKMDPVVQQEFRENMRTAAQTYARENIAVDMSKQLNKEVWVDFAAEGRESGGYATVRELVTPVVSGTGVITFVPVQGLSSQRDIVRASTHAQKLNKMYSSRTMSLVNAAQKLGGLSDDLRREYTVRTFQSAMKNVAREPLREVAQEADEPLLGMIATFKEIRRFVNSEGLTEEEAMAKILSGEVEVSQTIKESVAYWQNRL